MQAVSAVSPSSRDKVTPIAARTSRMTGTDLGLAALLGGAALVGYAGLAVRLAQGQYFEYFNLAFDFDAAPVLSLLTGSSPDAFGVKHPLMLLLRPLGLALLALGLPAKTAAAIVMAASGGVRVAFVFAFLRVAKMGRPEAVALALLFAVTSTQMIIAMVTETYGFASLSLILVWFIAQSRLDFPSRFRLSRYVAAVGAAGITITNAMQPIAAELLVLWKEGGVLATVRKLLLFGLLFGAMFGAVALLVWYREIVHALSDPIGAAKAVWWLQTKGPSTGLLKVLQTVFGFSFVSPNYTVVLLPETTRMIDFREWSFPGLGHLVVAAWLVFFIIGTVAGLAHSGYRPTAVAIGITLLFNVLFHVWFQFRGSVYIYTGHTHFLVFALAAGVGPWVAGRRRARAVYLSAVLALAVSVAAVNVPSAAEFTRRFDIPDTHCPAPCAEPLR